MQGRIGGGRPPKIGKNVIFFGVKSWFFTRNTPNKFPPLSARRNFFKFVPPTWNSGSAPVMCSARLRHGPYVLQPRGFCPLSEFTVRCYFICKCRKKVWIFWLISLKRTQLISQYFFSFCCVTLAFIYARLMLTLQID
jgi:hypothetical protein